MLELSICRGKHWKNVFAVLNGIFALLNGRKLGDVLSS
jgi:hypothetical protein